MGVGSSSVVFLGLRLMVPNPDRVMDFPGTILPLDGTLTPFLGFFATSEDAGSKLLLEHHENN